MIRDKGPGEQRLEERWIADAGLLDFVSCREDKHNQGAARCSRAPPPPLGRSKMVPHTWDGDLSFLPARSLPVSGEKFSAQKSNAWTQQAFWLVGGVEPLVRLRQPWRAETVMERKMGVWLIRTNLSHSLPEGTCPRGKICCPGSVVYNPYSVGCPIFRSSK